MQIEREESVPAEPLARICCLSGCTAVGKTELALRWAEENQAEIVNCDSLLFYRGMDIGTAKPTSEELARVPHHLIDVCDVSEQMDIGLYVEQAIEAIRDIQGRGKRVLVTGGSGFYLKAFFQPVVDQVKVSPETSKRVQALMQEGIETTVSELRRLNPEGLGSLDVENPRRVSKALERCLESGLTLDALKAAFAAETNDLVDAPKSLCVLERDKLEINARIEKRVDIMLGEGLVSEVESLLSAGLEQNPSACNAIGYREVVSYIRGEYDQETMKEKIATNTRRLAKKQRTWFRGQMAGLGRHVDLSGGTEPPLDLLFESVS